MSVYLSGDVASWAELCTDEGLLRQFWIDNDPQSTIDLLKQVKKAQVSSKNWKDRLHDAYIELLCEVVVVQTAPGVWTTAVFDLHGGASKRQIHLIKHITDLSQLARHVFDIAVAVSTTLPHEHSREAAWQRKRMVDMHLERMGLRAHILAARAAERAASDAILGLRAIGVARRFRESSSEEHAQSKSQHASMIVQQ